MIYVIMGNLRDIIKKININCPILFNESMKNHTTFRIGGPADVYIKPENREDLVTIYRLCSKNTIPLFMLGGGANILVSDHGIRGVVLDITSLCRIEVKDNIICAEAGVKIHDISVTSLEHNLGGAEFLYSMPGTVGGALWMNARCYEREIGDICVSADILDTSTTVKTLLLKKSDFGYKASPFQQTGVTILGACFSLIKGNRKTIEEKMESYHKDRQQKGHFTYPSAGSVFKNNRNFGKTAGEIIDSLCLKGYCIGGAQISEKHANIIVNRDNATATDVWKLITFIQKTVKKKLGLNLEREIILVGEFKENDV
jgi:UDP-N-acetylmuramate dehydrogenase